jgi:uncharacterized protein YecE (DUF72 family)
MRKAAATTERPAGRLRAGTSGFAYPAWAPRFYPEGLRGDGLLRHYGTRLGAVELNNTFYQQPSEAKVRAWTEAVPLDFRFAVKAQRGGTFRAWQAAAGGRPSLDWLTGPYRAFGERLGAVLYRVSGELEREDDRLARLLAAWPGDLPLVVEFQHPSWEVDEVLGVLRDAGAAWCVTELDDADGVPSIHVTGDRLYLRLRRHDYDEAGISAGADRITTSAAARTRARPRCRASWSAASGSTSGVRSVFHQRWVIA